MPEKKHYYTEKQVANIILAARGESGCPRANNYVKRLDRKYRLNNYAFHIPSMKRITGR